MKFSQVLCCLLPPLLTVSHVSAIDCAPPPANLVAWWKAENQSFDSAGGLPAAFNGEYGPGKVGTAFNLDGTDDAITIGDPASLHLQQLTIEFWVKRGSTSQTSLSAPAGAIIGGGSGSYAVAMEQNGQIVLSKTGIDKIGSDVVINDLNWHHVAVTKSESETRIYLDGVRVGQAAYAPEFSFNGSPIRIGALGEAFGGFTYNFLGAIDELSIYSRALSADEIGSIYVASVSGKCPTCIPPMRGLAAWLRAEGDASDWTFAHPGTFASPKFAAGKVGQAFEFDGSNEVLIPDAPDLNFSAFSAEAWVYPTLLDGDIELIMNKEINGGDSIAFEFSVKGPKFAANTIPTGNLALFLGGLSGLPSNYSGWADCGVAIPLNLWSHVVITYGEGVASAYVNGVLAKQFTGLTGTLRTTTGPLKIGSRSEAVLATSPESRFNGRIDEPSLYSRVLTATEVAALFQAGDAGKCSDSICVTPQPNLTVWLRAEGDASDWTYAHPGTFASPKFAPGKVGQAFDFDGTNEVVLADNPAFNTDTFTLETWIYPTSLDGAVDMIANKESGMDFSQFQFEIGLKGPVIDPGATSIIPQGNVAFYLQGITGLPDEYGGWVDGKAAAPLNQWTHVALAVEPGSVAVFVNGVETRRLSGLGGTINRTTGPLKIGSRHESFTSVRPAERFNGRIDEFTFYTRRLADGEIAAIHAAGGFGKCFDNAPSGNLELVLEAPAKVGLANNFTLTARVINHGFSPATQVMITNTIPLGVSVAGITNSQGTSTNRAGIIVSTLGIVPGGQTATVQIVCQPLFANTYQVLGKLARAETDPVPADDQQMVSFEAVPLDLAIGAELLVTEGANPLAEIPVRLSGVADHEVTVDFFTLDGTALAGSDFTGVTGKLIFAPGSAQAVVQVPILNDAFYEPDQTLTVILTNAVGAPLLRSNSVVTIRNDDAPPTLAVNDRTLAEGQSGDTVATLSVRLTGASEAPVTVNYATVNGTATSPTDFVQATGTLTFAPGDKVKTVDIHINPDSTLESNEHFSLNLSDPVNAEVTDGRGLVVLVNDDYIPGVVSRFGWELLERKPDNVFSVRLTARDGANAPVTTFNGVVQLSAVADGSQPTTMVISEVDVLSPTQSSIEFSNVSTNTLDLSDWTITLYDSTTWPLPRGTVSLSPGTTLAPTNVFRLIEGTGVGSYPNLRTGFPLLWGFTDTAARHVAVLLRDAGGRIVDFFCAQQAYPDQIAIPVTIPAGEWTDLPLTELSSSAFSYQRTGNSDNNNSRDWAARSPTPLRLNPLMASKFVDSTSLPVSPSLAQSFQGGVWTGDIQITGFAPWVAFRADDGNGNIGFSEQYSMGASDDLVAKLAVTPAGAAHPAQLVHYTASVTNSGPAVATNVVVEIRLPGYFGSFQTVVSGLSLSQGTHKFGTYLPTGNPAQAALMVTGLLGDLAAGQTATIQFEISKNSVGGIVTVPTNLVATATAGRDGTELNLANNVAEAGFELNFGCVPLNENVMSFWRGEFDGTDVLERRNVVHSNGAFSAGRILPNSAGFFVSPNHPIFAAHEPNFALRPEFTLEAWTRMTDNVRRERIILFDQRDATSGAGLVLFVDQGRLAVTLTDTNGATYTTKTQTPRVNVADLRDGLWHHVAVAVDRRTETRRVALLVDGVLTQPTQVFPVLGGLGNSPLVFGTEGDPATTLTGVLDEVTIYAAALTQAELVGIFRAGGAGKCLAELAINFANPAPVGDIFPTFPEALSYGRPVKVAVTVTNLGPLNLPASWVATALTQSGTARFLTEAKDTNVVNPSTTYLDFGPLAARSGTAFEIEVLLTNIPTLLATELVVWPQDLGQSYRLQSKSAVFHVNPDGDADGAADAWELVNGFDPLNALDATADTDGDGVRNVDEYMAGTDPRSAADVLKLKLTSVDGANVRLQFDGKPGRTYVLGRRAQLDAGDWIEVGRGSVTESGVLEFTDPAGLAGGGFYRLEVQF